MATRFVSAGRLRSATVLVALLLASVRASADVPEVNLRYERGPRAESCGGADELRASVAARLGRDPFVWRADVDTVVVRLRRVGPALEGTFERHGPKNQLRGKPSKITSKAGDCAEIMSAFAVGIAIAIDPLSLTRESPPPEPAPSPTLQASPPPLQASPLPAEPAPPAPRDEAARPPPIARSESVPVRVHLGAGPSVTFGSLPQVAPGARVSFGVSRGMLEVDLEGRLDPPVTRQAEGGRIEASLALVTFAPCLRYEFLLSCAQMSLGALRGTSVGFDHTREDNTFYVAAGARAGVEFSLSRHLAVRAMGEGQIPLRPTRLLVVDTPVWSTPAFAFSLVPMLVARFP
ncbi:hypothetical protein LVJ94_48895 [Pendulispora rubella]|uniref:Uncharacterized protein n=1 Tax=Pendulispora rubella TaxID=2741070 RepID=A0ABZ2L6J3_9BACT